MTTPANTISIPATKPASRIRRDHDQSPAETTPPTKSTNENDSTYNYGAIVSSFSVDENAALDEDIDDDDVFDESADKTDIKANGQRL